MKVCLANDAFPPLVDGVTNTVVNYASIIKQKYGDAVVATPRYPGVEDNYPFEVVRYTSFNTVKMIGYRTGYPFSKAAMDRITSFGPDIIHSHCPMASTYLAREVRDVTDAPLVFTYHTKFDIDIKRAVKLKFIQEPAINAIIRNIEACDDVWVVNRGAGENLKQLGYSGGYTVMTNGVDIDTSPADEKMIEKVNSDCAAMPGVPVFLFVGRMMWYKGLRIILDGLRIMKDAGQKFRMIFVGQGDDFEEVREYVEKNGLSADCVFAGAIYDRELLKAYYTRADMFLLPSVFDNNPLVVKEAAACSTASLLIRNSSSADGVASGENGILIGEDAQEFAREMLSCCRSENKMKTMGINASHTLYSSWDDSVAKAVKRYGEVIKKCSQRGYRHPKAHYDGPINLLADAYKNIMRARNFREDVKNEAKANWEDNCKTYDDLLSFMKEKYNSVKDHFDRYQ